MTLVCEFIMAGRLDLELVDMHAWEMQLLFA
jgi:hypothetical protein